MMEPVSPGVSQKLQHSGFVWSVAWSGTRLATGCEDEFTQDNCARIFDVSSSQEVMKFRHNSPVSSVAWNATGTHLATACVYVCSNSKLERIFLTSNFSKSFFYFLTFRKSFSGNSNFKNNHCEISGN